MMKKLSVLLLALIALGNVAGAITINGQLEKAGLERQTSDPTGFVGRVFYDTALGKARIYKSTGWTNLGDGAGAGGINYITNPDAEAASTGCTAYKNSVAAASPETGTGGSPTITCTRTTSSPLRGTGSFLITKDAANRQGEGVAFSFSIDPADAGKLLTASLDYSTASGTYGPGSDTTDPDLTAWVYGPTDGTPVLTQLAPYKVLGGTVVQKFQGQFQTAASGVAYRLILHESLTTSATGYTFKLDNIQVGPDPKSYGPAVTDMASFTPTGTWTNTTYTGLKGRIGDTGVYSMKATATGTPAGGALRFNLPSGEVIDTNKMLAAATNDALPKSVATVQVGGVFYQGQVIYVNTTQVGVLVLRTDGTWGDLGYNLTHTQPTTAAAGAYVTVNFSVPISGWSSSVQMGTDASTRVVAVDAYRSGAQTLAPNNSIVKVNMNAVSADTHAAFDTTNFKYVIPVSGWYQISTLVSLSGTNVLNSQYQTAVYVNGSASIWGATVLVAASTVAACPASGIKYLNAGDYIETYFYGAGNNSSSTVATQSGNSVTYLKVNRISGPAQIAASETVAARYTMGTNVTISGTTILNYDTKVQDTHNAVTTGANWAFLAPISGTYMVCHQQLYSSAASAINTSIIDTGYTGGVSGSGFRFYNQTTTSSLKSVQGCMTKRLLAGESFNLRVTTTDTNLTAASSSGDSYIDIVRVGNY